MSDDYEANDEDDGDHGPAPAADPVLIALQLCAIANNKTVATQLRRRARLIRESL
jgi:hypothetical protein